MAKATVKMPEEFLLKISKLRKNTDLITEKVLKAGADVIVSKVRSNLKQVIGDGTKRESRSSGELIASLGVSPMKIDSKGNPNVKIGFIEPRKRQNEARDKSKNKSGKKRSYNMRTNAMIANVLEYGKHGQPPKPFLKPAIKKSEKLAIGAMEKKLDEEIEKL